MSMADDLLSLLFGPDTNERHNQTNSPKHFDNNFSDEDDDACEETSLDGFTGDHHFDNEESENVNNQHDGEQGHFRIEGTTTNRDDGFNWSIFSTSTCQLNNINVPDFIEQATNHGQHSDEHLPEITNKTLSATQFGKHESSDTAVTSPNTVQHTINTTKAQSKAKQTNDLGESKVDASDKADNTVPNGRCHISLNNDKSKAVSSFDNSSGSHTNSRVETPNSPRQSSMTTDDPSLTLPTVSMETRQTDFDDGWTLTEQDISLFSVWGLTSQRKKKKMDLSRKCHDTRLPIQPSTSKRNSWGRSVYVNPISLLFSFAKRYPEDLSKVKDMALKYGLLSSLPCMQCYEEYGAQDQMAMTDDDVMGVTDTASDGRCKRCGGQVASVESMLDSIVEFIRLAKEKDLVIHDVYPDGNCQFAAVVDQLRMCGDFEYSIAELRQAAVDYLRENPVSDDGTPYEQFLTRETWGEYLARMSKDGEWGDHMVLNALANILERPIVIYSTMRGQNKIEITPKQITDMDTDTNETIYLGHLGESHYISLRPNHGFKAKQEVEDISASRRHMFPLTHLNFMLRQLFVAGCVRTKVYCDTIQQAMQAQTSRNNMKMEIVGSYATGMLPKEYGTASTSGSGGMDMLFALEGEADDSTETLIMLYVSQDSKVCFNNTTASRKDLIPNGDVMGLFKLCPVRQKCWPEQVYAEGDQCFLQWLNLSSRNKDNFPIVIAFSAEWPDTAMEWITRHRNTGFPSYSTIQTIMNSGCHIVPAVPASKLHADILSDFADPVVVDTGMKDTWNISFTIAERELSKHITEDQKHVFLVFKCLMDMIICEHNIPSSVNTSVFFYALEKISVEEWTEHPVNCFLILLKRITKGFQDGHLSHYFMSEKNILKHLPDALIEGVVIQLNSFLRNPVMAIYKVLDKLNITASELAYLIDKIIGDMASFIEHDDLKFSFQEVFLPASTYIIRNKVESHSYNDALSSLLAIVSQMKTDIGQQRTIEELAKTVMSPLGLQQRWLFSLFIDISTGSTLAKTVCEGMPSIHISQVFGPDAAKLVCDTHIPEQAAIECGDLMYPYCLATMLLEMENEQAIISCLKYYLQAYSNLAGDAIVLPVVSDEAQAEMLALMTRWQRAPSRTASEDQARRVYADMITSSTLLNSLHSVHILLFNSCSFQRRTDEYVEFVPQLKVIVDAINKPFCHRNYSKIMQVYGQEVESDKMATVSLLLSHLVH